MLVISKETQNEYGLRYTYSSSGWTSNPLGEDYAIVPEDMEEAILTTEGYCDIELNEDGTEVVSFTAREIPEIEEPEVVVEPTTDEILNVLLGVE